MKATVNEECNKVRFDITKRYDDSMNKHNSIIDDMVIKRKRELAESKFLYDKASTIVEQNMLKMNYINTLFEQHVGMQQLLLECLTIINLVLT